jgi:acyl-CoA synthetase (AMP-forming)/AMP-acid ligase II
MIITGGENVYSAEVEAAMLKHPTVAQVAVIGTPDVRWGEKVTALIVTRPGASITEAELQQHCRSPLFGRFLQSAIGGSQDAPHIVECAHAALFRQLGEKLKLGARRQPTLDLSHLLTEFRKTRPIRFAVSAMNETLRLSVTESEAAIPVNVDSVR